jgi:hypothetical protein
VTDSFDVRPWWQRVRVIRPVAIVLWSLASLVAVATGWAAERVLAGAVWMPFGGAEILVGTDGVPAWVGGVLDVGVQVLSWSVAAAIAATVFLAIRGGGGGWLAVAGSGAVVGALGLGALLSGLAQSRVPALALALIGVGVVLLALRWMVHLVIRLRRRARAEAAPHSVLAAAEVRDVDVTMVREELHWVVRVVFTDREGRPRRARGTYLARATVRPKVGDKASVSYDARHPARALTTSVRLHSLGRGTAAR